MQKVGLKNQVTGETKFVGIGPNWVLFLFSGFFGFPLFLNKLNTWGMVFLVLAVVNLLLVLSGSDTADTIGNLLGIVVLGLCFWMLFNGNKLIVTNYLENGWKFVEPDSDTVKFAKRKWNLDGNPTKPVRRVSLDEKLGLTKYRGLIVAVLVLISGGWFYIHHVRFQHDLQRDVEETAARRANDQTPNAAVSENPDSVQSVEGRLHTEGAIVFLEDTILLNAPDAYSVWIDGAWPNQSSAQYVLVGINSGGTACPATFKLIDLSKRWMTNIAVSPEFGNCSDEPRTNYDGESVAIDFPAFRDAQPERYFYASGRLKKQ